MKKKILKSIFWLVDFECNVKSDEATVVNCFELLINNSEMVYTVREIINEN